MEGEWVDRLCVTDPEDPVGEIQEVWASGQILLHGKIVGHIPCEGNVPVVSKYVPWRRSSGGAASHPVASEMRRFP